MRDSDARRGARLRAWPVLGLAILGAAGLAWFARESAAAPSLADSNVVVVLVDALRDDRLGRERRGLPTSPFLDELTRRSVRFDGASSTSAQTVPSVLSLLSGVLPSRHGNQYFHDTASFRRPERGTLPQVPATLPSMAGLLRARGYRTGAVVTNPWLQEKWGFARGFERYEFASRARGRVVNTTALEIVDGWDRERPFFLYLHYMDVHFPHRPLAPFKGAFTEGLPGEHVYANRAFPDLSDEDRDFSLALYDECVRSMDEVLRELMAALDERGLARSTLFVVASDHGDEFGEHGGLGHGRTLYQEMLDVPLLFAHPALELHARRIAEPVSLVDVLPTVLELTGGAVPQGLMGRSLAPWILPAAALEAPPPKPSIAELGLLKSMRDGERKLIWWPADERIEAFELREDPLEQRALAQDQAWIAPWCAHLRGILSDTLPLGTDDAAAEPEPDDSELMRSLEALGYAR